MRARRAGEAKVSGKGSRAPPSFGLAPPPPKVSGGFHLPRAKARRRAPAPRDGSVTTRGGLAIRRGWAAQEQRDVINIMYHLSLVKHDIRGRPNVT